MERRIYSRTSQQLLFTLFDACRRKKTGNFRIHHHTTTEIGHITEGEGIYKIENLTYDVKKGKTFLVRSDEQHCIPTVTGEKLSSVNLHITPYYLWSICSDYVEPAVLNSIMSKTAICHEICGVEKYFKELEKMLYSRGNDSKIRRIVLMLVMEICDNIKADTKVEKPLVYLENIQKSVLYIEKHFSEEIKIENLTSVSNLSRSTFSAEFKKYTGMSAIDYVIIRRLEQAMFLLKNTELSISEVAGECGFTNLSNFNRQFKKMTKLTPGEYRK